MRKVKGITLISLVVTIIVLIILAGVSINLTIGENGIFNKAKYAKDDYNNAVVAEEEQLNELYAYLSKDELPENTKDTDAGTIVKLPEAWQTGKPSYVSTENGVEVISSKKVANVYAVSAGNGETVPVPVGFWYVGGDLSTGVVISDNKNDKDKYAGVKKNEKSYVGIDLEGNQFVWIPCTKSEYVKCNIWNGTTQTSTTLGNAWWDTTVDMAGEIQTQKYDGFYVGRYEAGLATTIEEYTTAQKNAGSKIYNKEGIPQSKAGVIPWTFIDWTMSQKNADSMYNTEYVNSGLITGTQWDVMINKIGNVEGKSLTNSQSWGNYYNSSLTYTGRYSIYDSNGYLSTFSEIQTNATKNAETCTLLSTGASETTKAYNLYDVAGNVWEWTEETSFYGGNSSTQYREFRSGCFLTPLANSNVAVRAGSCDVSITAGSYGFRVVLYIR